MSKTAQSTQIKRPIDFFIIGAPKCGTTAIDQYLSEHDSIFMAPKEMHHFLSNAPGLYPHFQDPTNYYSKFQDAAPNQITGESSVFYFYSPTALENIMAYNPKAKIIVFLRNPQELLPSLHQQFVKTLYEPIDSFEQALTAGSARDWSLCPKAIKDNKWLLDYNFMGSLGTHLQAVVDIVPQNQLHIIFYDDLKDNPKGVYYNVLDFLGVTPDNRQHFKRVNQRGTYRSKALASFLRNPPTFCKKIWHMLKPLFNKLGLGNAYSKMIVANQRTIQNTIIAPNVKLHIHQSFQKDIQKLTTITNRDLSSWL
jgi:hypothetical protein